MNLLRPLVRRFSPSGERGRLSILIFHRIFDAPDAIFPDEPDARRFDALVGRVTQWFNILPLDEAAPMLAAGKLPERAACITFDDGYADNRTLAMPVLMRHGVTATFFIATGFLDGGRMWNDTVVESVRRTGSELLDLDTLGLGRFELRSGPARKAAVSAILESIKYRSVQERLAVTGEIARIAGVRPPDDLMMTSEQVREMARAGMQIGAHTMTHPILARLAEADAESEIAGSKRMLESIIDKRVGVFAYPNGRPGRDYAPKDVEVVRRLGFDAAVSTHPAAAHRGADMLQLPRFTPWDRSLNRFGIRLVRTLATT